MTDATKPTPEQMAGLRALYARQSLYPEDHEALGALIDAYEATQRPIEADPNAPIRAPELPDYWDRRRSDAGKGPSVCAAELRRALAANRDHDDWDVT